MFAGIGCFSLLFLSAAAAPAVAELAVEDEWRALTGAGLSAWRAPHGEWFEAAQALLDSENEKLLQSQPGTGVLVNGAAGRTTHLVSVEEHADVELHLEWMVPQGSNSGVYLMGRYEIQILDSWGVETPAHSDAGGIYQRYHENPELPAEERGYEGRAPLVNASKAPGEWQQFEITFRAPRFDANGNKVENARFVRVVFNGEVVQEDQELSGPTRAAMFQDEQATGPLMIQGDHGPVAIRNVRMRQVVE